MGGRFEGCGDPDAINQLLMGIATDMDIPFISGLPIGHGAQNMALPMGLHMTLDTDRMTLSSSEGCVSM